MVHPSATTTRMSTIRTTSNDISQNAEMRLYLLVRQDVLWRSARPPQVAIRVSTKVSANTPAQRSAVTHAAVSLRKRVVSSEQSAGIS